MLEVMSRWFQVPANPRKGASFRPASQDGGVRDAWGAPQTPASSVGLGSGLWRSPLSSGAEPTELVVE